MYGVLLRRYCNISQSVSVDVQVVPVNCASASPGNPPLWPLHVSGFEALRPFGSHLGGGASVGIVPKQSIRRATLDRSSQALAVPYDTRTQALTPRCR